MIAGTGAVLAKLNGRRSFDEPGVKVGAASVYGPDGVVVASRSVLLPDYVPDCAWTNMAITRGELEGLPRDTTFGRRMYRLPNGLPLQLTVVLMGSDRASIHQPEYCLTGQSWQIKKKEHIVIPMARPIPYDLPVNKMIVAKLAKNAQGQVQNFAGIYVYWFVSGKSSPTSRCPA